MHWCRNSLFVCCWMTGSLVSVQVNAESALKQTSALAVYYSQGEYGQDQDTRIRYMPISHEIAANNWRFKVSAPLLEVSGPGNVLVNVGSVGGISDTKVSERGAGDTILTLTYELPAWSANSPFIDISAELKLPTADETRGLGTGKVDGGIQVDLYQQIGGATAFGTVAWKYRQSSDLFRQLKNSLAVSLGLSGQLNDAVQLGVIYDYRQPVSQFTGETHEVLPYVSWSVDARWSLMFYAVKGFTEDSADMALGSQVSLRW